jgi:predicted ribosome quality control (RQC) complex YloA/Tae2 family protein
VQLNYHFLKQLSAQLGDLLVNATFTECFCQQKDELIISFQLENNNYFIIRATLTSDFSCLSFPQEYKRSRKNSVNLFDILSNQKVNSIHQFANERAFSIHFDSGSQLLFKMFGNRSNIILIPKNSKRELFKNNLPKDKEINTEQLDRHINPSYEDFILNQKYSSSFPTFGNSVKPWLQENEYEKQTLKEKWELLLQLEKSLDKSSYFICKKGLKPTFSLLETSGCEPLSSDPISAINSFYQHFSKTYYFEVRKAAMLKSLEKTIKQNQNYIAKSDQKLQSLIEGTQPKEIGDIIMANLHAFSTGLTDITLFNFYTNSNIIIRLNKKLSPQKNAENYYRKGKNRKIELTSIEKSVNLKKNALEKVSLIVDEVKACESGKTLNTIIKENELFKTAKTETKNVPYKEFIIDGFRIWVGKNAKHNDELTLKYSFKEDLWLHAKDVPGSHVIVKYESNRGFNMGIIEKGAEIAAYYSKRKTDSFAPVIYTPSKYVRKRKGSLPGQVIVDKEKVILVTPKNPTNT